MVRRLNYCIAWALILALAEWRLGMPRSDLDRVLAAATLVLSFPANIIVVLAIVIGNGISRGALSPAFFDTHLGIAVGVAVFFVFGYLQWFVVIPWLVRRIRSRRTATP